LVDCEANNRAQQYDDPDDNDNFLCVHELTFRHTQPRITHTLYTPAGRGKFLRQGRALHEGV
jgi:hypothetical protein